MPLYGISDIAGNNILLRNGQWLSIREYENEDAHKFTTITRATDFCNGAKAAGMHVKPVVLRTDRQFLAELIAERAMLVVEYEAGKTGEIAVDDWDYSYGSLLRETAAKCGGISSVVGLNVKACFDDTHKGQSVVGLHPDVLI